MVIVIIIIIIIIKCLYIYVGNGEMIDSQIQVWVQVSLFNTESYELQVQV